MGGVGSTGRTRGAGWGAGAGDWAPEPGEGGLWTRGATPSQGEEKKGSGPPGVRDCWGLGGTPPASLWGCYFLQRLEMRSLQRGAAHGGERSGERMGCSGGTAAQ